MSKRNFILLIILLIIILVSFFGFLYVRRNPRVPGETPGGTNFLSEWNPFGSGNAKPGESNSPADISGYTPPDSSGIELIKVSSMPVAGYGIFLKERYKEVSSATNTEDEPATATPPQTELATAVRYVDQATGNIYQTFADTIEERKFSGTVIPKVHEAIFGNNSRSVLMRYLKPDATTIETFLGLLPQEILGEDTTGEIEVRGSFLPADITDISISPDSKSAFYLFNAGESAIGTTLEFATGKKTQVFDSPFNEWLSYWTGDGIIFATKPSFVAPGYAYKLNMSTKEFSQILSNIPGLTILPSPDGKKILHADSTLALQVYDISTKTATSLGVRTLPEKCTWAKGSADLYCLAPELVVGTGFPDAWYQGKVSFDDQLWKIELETGTASIVLDPEERIDGIKLSLDPSENFLFFVNKKDSFLWEVVLK